MIWRPASSEPLYLTACTVMISVTNLFKQRVGHCTYLTGRHHHATTDGVKRVGSDTGTSGDRPAKRERGQETTLERTNQDDGLEGVVHAEVETTVDNDTNDGRGETTVETSDTIRCKSFPVNIDEAVELTRATLGGVLGVVSETGTGVIEGVDEEQRGSTSGLEAMSARYCTTSYHWSEALTPPEARLPIIHLPYPSRSFLYANMDL